MNYDEAKKALHVLYADVNRKVLQMGPEMRASGLVSREAAMLCCRPATVSRHGEGRADLCCQNTK
jgi:hypothetical protein